MGRLKNKVVFITGSSAGIGRSSAILFASEGAQVAAIDIDQSGGEETINTILQNNGQGIFINADLTKPESVKEAIERTVREFGKLDVIYNNAGGSIPEDGPINKVSLQIWEKSLSTNLNSCFYCCKYGIPYLIKNGCGSIIMTGSIAGLVGWNRSAYTAAKGAIIALTRLMAVDYAKYNIRVNCLCPCLIITERTKKEAYENPLFAGDMKPLHLLGFGEPLDIAYSALYLASDESQRVTGSIFTIDSGYTATGRIAEEDILRKI